MPGSGIVYALTIRDTQRLAAFLRAQGINAHAYWGGQESDERERLGQSRAFLHPTPPGTQSLRMLVSNRLKIVNFRTRYRLQLGAVEDVLFPEFKQFFRARSTGRTARILLENFPSPAELASAAPEQVQAVVIG